MNNNKEVSINSIHDSFVLGKDFSFDVAPPSLSIEKVLDMLLQAQELVSTDDFDMDLEPTPIGPQAQLLLLPTPSTPLSIPFQSSDVIGTIPACVPECNVPPFESSLIPFSTMPSAQQQFQSQMRHVRNDQLSAARTAFHLKKSRQFLTSQWNKRFQELLHFKEQHGHLFVPNSYPPNQQLAQWVKRYVRCDIALYSVSL
jgi:hypothetical protein